MVTVNLLDFVSDHSKTSSIKHGVMWKEGVLKWVQKQSYGLNQCLRMLSDVRNRSPTQTGLNKDMYWIMWEWTSTEWKSRGVQIQAWLDQAFYFVFMWLLQVCIPLLTNPHSPPPASSSGIFGWLQLTTKTTLFSCSQRNKEDNKRGTWYIS